MIYGLLNYHTILALGFNLKLFYSYNTSEKDKTEAVQIKLEPITDLYPTLINDWSGGCVEGVPHGHGRCEFRSGSVYTGHMENGLMSGKGEIRVADGFTYRGDFKKNSLEGHGVIVFPDGAEYEGQVVDGYRHGQGMSGVEISYCIF